MSLVSISTQPVLMLNPLIALFSMIGHPNVSSRSKATRFFMVSDLGKIASSPVPVGGVQAFSTPAGSTGEWGHQLCFSVVGNVPNLDSSERHVEAQSILFDGGNLGLRIGLSYSPRSLICP